MTDTISLAQATDIAEAAGLDEEAMRPDYSGRGMYGRTCLGFIYTTTAELLELGAALKEALEEIPHAATDSMGRDGIVYFPYLAVETED